MTRKKNKNEFVEWKVFVDTSWSKSTNLKDTFFCAVLGLPELPRCSERLRVAFSLFRRL